MIEIWKQFREGRDKTYEVSDLGNIRSILKKDNSVYIKKQRVLSHGYLAIHMNQKYILVHHIVYESFIGKRIKNMHIDPINGIKTDNRVENLELVTPRENVKRAVNLNLYHPENYKLNELDVLDIKNLVRSGYSKYYVSKKYNICPKTVRDIMNYKIWKDIL